MPANLIPSVRQRTSATPAVVARDAKHLPGIDGKHLTNRGDQNAAMICNASVAYRLYRSPLNSATKEEAPGPRCVVIVTIDFDGPDEPRLRQWIDGVIDARGETAPDPAMISAH